MTIVKGRISPFGTMGDTVHDAANALRGLPLSGYLAGKARGGRFVCALEDAWCEMFGVRHAIACNSATSGLLAAAFAVRLGPGNTFVCPAMTMSATAAAPMFTGATPYFMDVSDDDFGLRLQGGFPDTTKAIFTTNLFGHPSLIGSRQWFKSEHNPIYLVEDNSQSPFAIAHGRYAGTMGHIGVWSMNVHKHIQCGEGGMVTTDDSDLAEKLRCFINHGENAGGSIGLNLRMPEICAAIGLSQLKRGKEIVAERIEQAEAIIAAIGGDIPGIRPPVVLPASRHVYYTIPFLVEGNRGRFCDLLREYGVPIVAGYVDPLYRLPAFKKFARPCPVAEDLEDRRLFYFENCAYSPTKEQIKQIGDAFKKAAVVL